MNDPPQSPPLREAALTVVQRLRQAGHEAFWVGGCVRDLLRGVPPDDYDIVTSARPPEIQDLFAKTIPVGILFGVVLVAAADHLFEVATYRTESHYGNGRHPDRVSFATAQEDVRRRDFTINGLLMDPLTGELVDYVGGRQDIEDRIIRAIGDPDIRFGEDHLRMLRAIRFAANLGFAIDAATLAAIGRQAAAIVLISAERIREELTRLLTGGGADWGMALLAETGLLGEILPEVAALQGVGQPPLYHPEGDVWEHTLGMLALLPSNADPCLAWAALLHDVGKAGTRTVDERGIHFYGHVQRGVEMAGRILERLRFANAQAKTVLELIHHHMHFLHVRQMRPHRLKRLLRQPRFDLHLELHRLDCLGSHGMLDHYDFCRDRLAELTREDLHPPRLLNGHDLIAMGYPAGALLKEILRAIEDAQLGGEISTPEEARGFVLSRFQGHQPDF